jgi:2-aminoadipate transaminase
MDGRGRNAMRLNFSGVSQDEIREGVRRIGEIVQEQVDLYGTLTGEEQAPRPAEEPAPREEGGRVVRMPERRAGEGRARSS